MNDNFITRTADASALLSVLAQFAAIAIAVSRGIVLAVR
jgi:hypothetical protein